MAEAVQELGIDAGAKELVRLVVMGSVDDGKSTLLGRLLYETGSLAEDQVEQVRRASRNGDPIDFSLFTDGLRAEREQGITIDVAYRYFETARRKFILADTPGHAQYTRNMATGASTAQAGIILVDARLGVLPQTRRHASIAALLGIPRLAVAINKMDLVGFDPRLFEAIAAELRDFAARLGFSALTFLPVCAREGDNVARKSARTPWHEGGTVLDFLESVEVAPGRARSPFRFPVQTVLRPHLDYRACAGVIASGTVAVGDEVVVLPAGTRTRVRSIDTFEGPLSQASAPLSVALRLDDAVDVGRGDLLAHPHDAPSPRKQLEATVVWLSERPLDPGRAYLVKHTTRTVPARVERVVFRLEPETLAEESAERLALNDLGRLSVRCARPLVADPYADNRATGAFILIDALSNETAAAGTILADGGTGALEVEAANGRAAVLLLQREDQSAAQSLAHQLEAMLSERGYLAAVVRRPEAAAACAAAGVLALWTCGPRLAPAEARALLADAGCSLVELPADGDVAKVLERALRALPEPPSAGSA